MLTSSKQTSFQPRATRGIARFRFEIELDDFFQRKSELLSDLANVLSIPVAEIRITDVRTGCVVLRVDVPEAAQLRLKQAWLAESDKALAEFARKYKVRWIRFDDMVERRFFVILDVRRESGRQVTWLHLSDAHLRSTRGAKKWAQDDVIEQFVDQLPSLLAERHLEPDFVFFTGDVAFSGQDAEYQCAKDFLDGLARALPKPSRFFFVPGNHDVTWSEIDPDFDGSLRHKLQSREAVNSHLLDESTATERQIGLKRLENFFGFVSDLKDIGQPSPYGSDSYYFHKVDDRLGLRIGIAGLNSAWRSTKKDTTDKEIDEDILNLILGEPQVRDAAKQLRQTHLRVALLHHPPLTMWFTDYDRELQHVNLSEFDVILRGHEHEQKYFGLTDLANGRIVYTFASGALYFNEEYGNNFNAVRVNLDKGTGMIYFWTYFRRSYAWRRDLGPTPNGFIEFQLPQLRERTTGTVAHAK